MRSRRQSVCDAQLHKMWKLHFVSRARIMNDKVPVVWWKLDIVFTAVAWLLSVWSDSHVPSSCSCTHNWVVCTEHLGWKWFLTISFSHTRPTARTLKCWTITEFIYLFLDLCTWTVFVRTIHSQFFDFIKQNTCKVCRNYTVRSTRRVLQIAIAKWICQWKVQKASVHKDRSFLHPYFTGNCGGLACCGCLVPAFSYCSFFDQHTGHRVENTFSFPNFTVNMLHKLAR